MRSKRFCAPRRLTRGTSTWAQLLLATVVLWVPSAAAGTPDWLRAIAQQPLPKYPDDTSGVVVWDEQLTTVNQQGEIKTLYRRAYKILRAEGRGHGTVVVYFDDETRLTYFKAWSIPAQGKEYEVKEKEAVETSPFSEALYLDTRLKVLKIPGAEPGSLIGYEYEQKRRPYVLQDTWSFQEEIPVRHSRFTLQLPAGWEYNVFWLNHAVVEPRATSGNQWTWELENVPAVEREPSMPPWRAVAGRLAVTYFPREADSRRKSHGSWRDVGQWYAQLAVPSRQATPEIKKKVAELTASASTALDKIRTLADFVQQQVRYVAIEIGIGGYQPHAAQAVFTSRYGDCKDKATLLSTMLREAGIDSYYALTHSRRGVVAPAFPSMLNFNHVILAIRLPEGASSSRLYAVLEDPKLGPLLFFDPTDRMTPLGYLPSNEQANYGLLVAEEAGQLVKLPLLPPASNRLQRSARLTLTSSGILSGEIEEVRRGAPAVESRARLLGTPPAQRVKVLEEFLGDFVSGSRLTSASAENLENFGENLVLRYRFVAENYGKTAGNLLLVRPRVLGQKSSDLLEKKERKQPVEFPDVSFHTDTFEISLPPGYEVEELPPPVQADYPFGEYRSSVEKVGNVLRYTRTFLIKDLRVPHDRLDELKKFYRQIAEDERSSAVLRRAAP